MKHAYAKENCCKAILKSEVVGSTLELWFGKFKEALVQRISVFDFSNLPARDNYEVDEFYIFTRNNDLV